MSEPKKTLVEGLKVEEGREPLNSDWPECEEFYNLMQQYRHAAVSVPSLVLDRYNAIKAWLRQQETAQTHEMVVRNLAMLVRRLIHRIRSKYKAPDDAVAKQAWDYLIGEGLQGSMLRKETAQHLKREQEGRRTTQEIAEAVVASYNGGFVREMQRVPRPGLVALVKEALDVERGQPREQEPAPREIVYKAIFDGCTHIEQTTRSDGKCEVCWGVACYVSQALAVQPPQELVSLREALQSVIDERDTELDMMHCPYTNGTREHDAWHQGVREAWERFDVVKRKARAALTRGAVGGGK